MLECKQARSLQEAISTCQVESVVSDNIIGLTKATTTEVAVMCKYVLHVDPTQNHTAPLHSQQVAFQNAVEWQEGDHRSNPPQCCYLRPLKVDGWAEGRATWRSDLQVLWTDKM